MASRTAPAPRRARLDRTAVVDAALALAAAEGLDAVTIRRLAQELSVTPMALYWHFADKDALLAGVAERLWDEVSAELAVSWDPEAAAIDRLRLLLDVLVAVLRRHPAVVELAPLVAVDCPSGLEVTERALGVLDELGMAGEEAAQVATFVLKSAMTLASSLPIAPSGDEDAWRRKRIALASLPPERYPRLVASAGWFTDCSDPEGYAGRLIGLVVDGVRARATA